MTESSPEKATMVESNNGTMDTEERRKKILEQLEYYFGDNNMPRDKFMQETLAKNDGWMPIDTLLTFNRLKRFLTGVEAEKQISEVVNAVGGSELLEVNETEKMLRRCLDKPLPDCDSKKRTVYLKGFPKDSELDDLLSFFKGLFQGVEAILMRHYKEQILETENDVTKPAWRKKFKGSIFMVFKTEEEANKCLATPLVYKDTNIEIKMSQEDYYKMKREEFLKRREKKEGKQTAIEKDSPVKKEPEGKQEQPPAAGSVLKLSDMPPTMTREEFRELFYKIANEEKCKIVFLDFNKGDTDGYMRMEQENSATTAIKEFFPDNTLSCSETEAKITLSLLTKEEEDEYFSKVSQKRKETQQVKRNRGNRGGPRGRNKRRRYN